MFESRSRFRQLNPAVARQPNPKAGTRLKHAPKVPRTSHGVLAPRARWRERVVAYGCVLPRAAATPRAAGLHDAGVKPTPRARWALTRRIQFEGKKRNVGRGAGEYVAV